MSATLSMKLELLATVAGICGIGMLVKLGVLGNEYAALAIGALGGSGIRSIAGATTIPAPPKEPPADGV